MFHLLIWRSFVAAFHYFCLLIQLMSPESGKVFALDVNLPVKQAIHLLHEQGITVAPLWDFCNVQFVGVITASDFVLILREVTVIDDTLHEAVPNVSSVDLEVSRRRISVFLSTHTAYELLPESSKVIVSPEADPPVLKMMDYKESRLRPERRERS